MRIAILTSGILPVPAVQGGAVENLLDFCLAYNDRHHLHDITIYSIYHPEVAHHSALQSQVNHYHYINTSSFTARIAKRLFRYIHGDKVYYHHSVEYFLNRALAHVQKNNYDAILLENRPGYALKIREKSSSSFSLPSKALMEGSPLTSSGKERRVSQLCMARRCTAS